jgi:hypothetical protein
VAKAAGIADPGQPAFSNKKEDNMEIINLVLVAMFIEAVVNALKPIWEPVDGKRLTVAELVSMGIGVVLAVAGRINMLQGFVQIDAPEWLQYLFYVMTGIALGRGPSFLYDLWTRIKEWQGKEPPVYELIAEDGYSYMDLVIANWGLQQLRAFCVANGIPCEDCVTREDYMNAIESGGIREETEPPIEGGVN